jgi:hypothetical protein
MVNAVAPGATMTPMIAWLTDDLRSGIEKATPLGRMAMPDDIADVVAFLAPDSARQIAGRTLLADGGLVWRIVGPSDPLSRDTLTRGASQSVARLRTGSRELATTRSCGAAGLSYLQIRRPIVKLTGTNTRASGFELVKAVASRTPSIRMGGDRWPRTISD